jgi:hypothetical protein
MKRRTALLHTTSEVCGLAFVSAAAMVALLIGMLVVGRLAHAATTFTANSPKGFFDENPGGGVGHGNRRGQLMRPLG